jgi:hypothetical protein
MHGRMQAGVTAQAVRARCGPRRGRGRGERGPLYSVPGERLGSEIGEDPGEHERTGGHEAFDAAHAIQRSVAGAGRVPLHAISVRWGAKANLTTP